MWYLYFCTPIHRQHSPTQLVIWAPPTLFLHWKTLRAEKPVESHLTWNQFFDACVLTDDIIMLFMYRQNKITLLGVLLFWINIINNNLDGAILKNRNIWFCIEIPQIKLVRFCTSTCCKKCILPWSEIKRVSAQQNYHRHPALLIICNNRIPYTSYIFIQSSFI